MSMSSLYSVAYPLITPPLAISTSSTTSVPTGLKELPIEISEHVLKFVFVSIVKWELLVEQVCLFSQVCKSWKEICQGVLSPAYWWKDFFLVIRCYSSDRKCRLDEDCRSIIKNWRLLSSSTDFGPLRTINVKNTKQIKELLCHEPTGLTGNMPLFQGLVIHDLNMCKGLIDFTRLKDIKGVLIKLPRVIQTLSTGYSSSPTVEPPKVYTRDRINFPEQEFLWNGTLNWTELIIVDTSFLSRNVAFVPIDNFISTLARQFSFKRMVLKDCAIDSHLESALYTLAQFDKKRSSGYHFETPLQI